VENKQKKRMGRPPGGKGSHGEPERIRDYPKLALTIRPATKAKLDAVAVIEGRPAWRVVEDGIDAYIGNMPPEDRKAVQAVVERIQAKASQ